MTFDPASKGFKWTSETAVKNASGTTMSIRPSVLRAGYDTVSDERSKECYRLYDTPMGLLSELEIKHWQAGGLAAEKEMLEAYHELFRCTGSERLPLKTVIDSLLAKGFAPVQIEVVIGWLIKGQYVDLDRDKLEVSDTR